VDADLVLKRLTFAFTLVLGLLAFGGTASAGTIKVTTTLDEQDSVGNSTCSLREAISTANFDVDLGGCTDGNNATTADTVSLSGADYALTRGNAADEDNNIFGDLDVTEALTISGAGADVTGIYGNGAVTAERALHLSAGKLTLTGVQVYGGDATADTDSGGGIRADPPGNTLTLIDSVVSGNAAANGAGIQASGVTLTRSSVSGNRSTVSAGGIRATVATLTDSSVSHNTAANGGGGGISAPTTKLTRTVVSDNSAAGAGGLVLGGGTITDSRIARNQGGSSGGFFMSSGSLTILRSTILWNHARGGGGGGLLLSSPGTYTIKNTTVSGNSATGNGGGITIGAGTANLNNVTIARNTADSNSSGGEGGGGIAEVGATALRLRNSLVAENTALGAGAPECVGVLTNPSYNAFTTGGGCTVVGTSVGNFIGGSPIGGLLDNGGLTPTHELLPGNLAINAGYPGTGTGIPCETTDQRGLPRGGAAGRCDIGAFEMQP
jgi:CSLREA domain-containing protein